MCALSPVCVRGSVSTPQRGFRGQRTALKSGFSPSAVGSGDEIRHQPLQQSPLSTAQTPTFLRKVWSSVIQLDWLAGEECDTLSDSWQTAAQQELWPEQ